MEYSLIWKLIVVDCLNGLQRMVPKKFQLMFLGLTRHRRLHSDIEGNKVSATDCVKLLGVEIDNKLKFDKHVKTLCSKQI